MNTSPREYSELAAPAHTQTTTRRPVHAWSLQHSPDTGSDPVLEAPGGPQLALRPVGHAEDGIRECMCELFAMSSRYPATVNLSLDTFSRRGGATAHHRDGWGIGYYIDGAVQVIRESTAAADSPTVHFVQEHHYRSTIVLGHVRKATQGRCSLANTQPFQRELGGRPHLFAHNGDLEGVQRALQLGRHRPIGTTDSEFAFCALLALLAPLWTNRAPTVHERQEVVADFARRITPLGPANFLYSDGELLLVHGHQRTQPDGQVRPPGLWHLCRSCRDDGGMLIEAGVTLSSSRKQEVHLVASVPLTDEPWIPFEEGQLLTLAAGVVLTG